MEDFLVITMQNVSVASVQPSGTFGGDPLEMVYLSYSTATIGYKPQQADGQLGAEVIASVLGCPS